MDKQFMQVVGTHPETYSVDLLDWRSGWRMDQVPVMVGPATGRTGAADLPVFSEESPGLAIMDMVDGNPVVLGFIHTRLSALRFADGRAIDRHDSDVYQTIDREGEFELYHPSGAMIRMGEGEAHVDLTGLDHDGQWALAKNTGKTVKLTLQVGASKIVISDEGVDITSPALTHNGVDVGDTHIHGGVQTGGSNTGVPV
jgi:hypothetical protein